MIQTARGQQIKPMVHPRGAPLDGEVTLTAIGMLPFQPVRIGFGSYGQYEIVGRAEADATGNLMTAVLVPYWAVLDRVHFVFLSFGGGTPRAVSDPFLVTRPDGTIRIFGTISADGTSCLALDGPDNTLFSLQGDVGTWSTGQRVEVIGTIPTGPVCGGQGLPIAVIQIRPA